MSSLSLTASGVAGYRAMALIEARRMARHPVFLAGVVLAVTVRKKPEEMPQEADTRDARDVNVREHEGQPAYEGA